ncbi:MAG: aromatic amino acid lyase [Desulfobacterales bacterium]|nr:aromatic amino acid lyase [Desulfobacterales bacterium]
MSFQSISDNISSAKETEQIHHKIVIKGDSLSIDDVVNVARFAYQVILSGNETIAKRIQASVDYINNAVESGEPIYGVTSNFGGMSNIAIPKEEAILLQNNLPWPHKTGTGNRLSNEDVRSAMLLRANSFLIGVSGVRIEIIHRLILFLNNAITPHVYDMGSIGASGDLVPLSYIAGSLMGLDSCYQVSIDGQDVDALHALKRLGLNPISLNPKEGLSIINGTSVMTGIAANCIYDARIVCSIAMAAHALFLQGLRGTNQSFHPFIHQHKPHPGQLWTAQKMLDLLNGSHLIYNELDGYHGYREKDLIQDRYSLRCIPQYFGPIIDGLTQIAKQIEIEINSPTDNPLIDSESGVTYHCGNFLGQYIGVSMDQLRYYLSLLAKHLDVQIALLVSPEFNNGLSPSLVGNPSRRVNLGLKGLQISANSMMPLISFYGNSLADRFPTHAEQFNQNINSQGFGSANLARKSIDIFQQYIAICLIFGVQSVDLRSYLCCGSYDSRKTLSRATIPLYEAIRKIVGIPPSDNRPYIFNDHEQALDEHIALLTADIKTNGYIVQSLHSIIESLKCHRC